jgi:hypothetical protein
MQELTLQAWQPGSSFSISKTLQNHSSMLHSSPRIFDLALVLFSLSLYLLFQYLYGGIYCFTLYKYAKQILKFHSVQYLL